MMFLQIDLICWYIYLVQVILVTSFIARIGHFKLSDKSSNLTQCASQQFISEKGINGIRVSEPNGTCEVMSGKLDEKHIEPGFGYATLISTKESFKPPISLKENEHVYIKISITTLDRFSLYVTWPKRRWDRITIGTQPFGSDKRYQFSMSIRDYIPRIIMSGPDFPTEFLPYDRDTLPGTECKITFVARGNNSIEVLFNETAIATWKVENLRWDQLEIIFLSYNDITNDRGYSFLVRGSEVTQG